MKNSTFIKKNLISAAYLLACGKNPLYGERSFPQCESEIKQYHEKKLRQIINYSLKSSPFYSRTIKDLNMSHTSVFEFMQSIPYLEKEHVRVGNIRVPCTKGIIRETTGSTGIPVRVCTDQNTLAAQLKSRWIFFGWHGVVPGLTEGRFWGRMESRNFRSLLRDFLLNRKVFQLDRRDVKKFEDDLTRLKRSNPDYFYGYASLLLKVAEIYDQPGKERPRPRVIFSTAEMLNEMQREYISSVFDCPVVQEYGCSEVDIIAFECPHARYHVNTNRLYVEFPMVDSGDREVVVTDLDNRCTPLLRYRLGDFAELTNVPCPCGRPAAFLKRVVGRSVARLVPLPDGSFFHSVKFAHLTEHLCEQGFLIRQFRVDHLRPQKIIFRLSGEFDNSQKKAINSILIIELNRLVKEMVEIEIMYCDIEIDGKHSYYVKHF